MDIKKSIVQAFVDIGNAEGFDNVTINKIVEKCNISRTAFYYHFKDIPDVIDFYMDDRLSGVMVECANTRDMQKGIEHCVKELIYNFPECRKLADSKWKKHVEVCLHENWIVFAKNIFGIMQKNVPITIEEKNFIIYFMTGGICHYVLYGDHEEITAKVFAEQFYLLLKSRYDTMGRGK